jgi:two-component system chemotaxis response regulator CheY
MRCCASPNCFRRGILPARFQAGNSSLLRQRALFKRPTPSREDQMRLSTEHEHHVEKFLRAGKPSRRILVADDDPVIRRLLTNIVEKEGYAAVAVENGRKAYRILQSDADFSGAIFDMRMPNIDGLDVVRYMRTEKRLMRIPVLMITAEQDLRFTAASFAAGASLFLPKPFTPAQFQTTFKILVGDSSVAA